MLKVLFPWKQNNTKKVLFAMEQVVNGAEPTTEELPPEDLPLLPCHVCNRTFLPNPLKKHIRVCEQTLRRKRKPFDSLKQRVEGTDMAPFYQKSYLKRSNPEISSLAQAGDVYGNNKVSKWREKHFELQKTIKNAKGTRSDMSTNPPTNTSTTPNRKVGHLAVSQSSSNERCPVCERSFGPKAFDRHVEFCKEQKNRVQVHKSPAVVQQAKERLDARINYRVPPLRQSKRALVRDKYCPTSQTNLLHRSNSIGPTKSTTSSSMSVTTMASNRRQPIINIEKNVERNNKKETASKTRIDRTIGDCGDSKESTKNENGSNRSSTTPTISIHYDPFEKAHLQLMELIEDDNYSVPSSPMSTLSTPILEFRPFLTPKSVTGDRSGGKRASVIDPPYGFQDVRASRDLDQEFELLESLMNNNLDETSERPHSDRGASIRRRRDLSDDIYQIDPSLINEQDNLSIPERLPSDAHSPARNGEFELGGQLTVKPTVRSLPLIRPDQVRLAPDGSSAESQTGEGRRRSPGSYTTKIKAKSKMRIDFSPESQKNKSNRRLGTSSLSRHGGLEIKKALAEEKVDVSPKEETFKIDRTPTAEELYPDNPMMYEEFRKYEEMYRREKEERGISSRKQKKTADFGIHIEDISKTYGDSAYGSLNRKQQMEEHEISNQLKEFGADKISNAISPSEKLPKFCHECGNRYPVPSAKFCVECGVKRLVL